MLFILMACGDEGGPASSGNAKSMAVFSRLHEEFERFANIQQSTQFSTLSPGFTFESNGSCAAGFVESRADFGNLTRITLTSTECAEFTFEGDSYFYILNSAPLDNGLMLRMSLVFYEGRPESRTYDLNCMDSDCDYVGLILAIVDSEGDEVVHYHGMPDVLTVQGSERSVSASFNGPFYTDFEEEDPINVAGTLVCCQ